MERNFSVLFLYFVFCFLSCDFNTESKDVSFNTSSEFDAKIEMEEVATFEAVVNCSPGERICSFSDVLMCKLDGSDFVFLKNCPGGCKDGDCIKEEEKKDPTLYDDIDFWPQEYSSSGLTWNHSPITYCFENSTSDLSKFAVKESIEMAFALWAEYIPLIFEERNCLDIPEPDIKIRFGVGDHGGCQFSFNGPGKVLAHAFYPGNWSNGGDVHFDDAEKWTFNLPIPSGEYDLVTVAAHELGHSLGLQHSFVKTALMYNTYSGEHRYLDPDDIAGIKALYPGKLPPKCDDKDKDGYGTYKTDACSYSGVDCNDSDATIHPGQKEICDKKDNDCDGQTDEDQTYWNKNCGTCTDLDKDGYGKKGTNIVACLYSNKFDCNDADADVYPGAIEFCDKLDNNCNGIIDEDPKFYNNCGKCGPDEIGVGDSCGKCGTIKCKPGGGVMCDEPCPAGQSCCGNGCMPDGGDCCVEKGLGTGYCKPNEKCVGNNICCSTVNNPNPKLCGNKCCKAEDTCHIYGNNQGVCVPPGGEYCGESKWCGQEQKCCGESNKATCYSSIKGEKCCPTCEEWVLFWSWIGSLMCTKEIGHHKCSNGYDCCGNTCAPTKGECCYTTVNGMMAKKIWGCQEGKVCCGESCMPEGYSCCGNGGAPGEALYCSPQYPECVSKPSNCGKPNNMACCPDGYPNSCSDPCDGKCCK